MLRPFPGFARFPTDHCVTGSLKHVYEFHGQEISEDLLLGLGCGLGFVYFHFKEGDPFFGGRANVSGRTEEGMEITAGRRTGVMVETHVTSSARKAQATLREMLEAGEPALVYLDMGLLPYFDFPEEFHFGGHVVVVVGFDPETQRVLVADRDSEPHPVEWEALEQARGSKYKPFPPQHRWYTFDFAAARAPGATEVREAIGDVCRGMLDPPIANLGTKGIRKAAKEVVRWPEILAEDALRRTCSTAAIFIDRRGGTGGGIFRFMYAGFLREAAVIADDPRLADLGSELVEIGDLWEQVAAAFEGASQTDDPPTPLESASATMVEVADREEAFWERLAATTT